MSGRSAPETCLFFFFLSSPNLQSSSPQFQRGARHLILSARLLLEPVISQGGSCRMPRFAFECLLHVAFAISEHFKKILVELKELCKLEILMHTNDAFSKIKIIKSHGAWVSSVKKKNTFEFTLKDHSKVRCNAKFYFIAAFSQQQFCMPSNMQGASRRDFN